MALENSWVTYLDRSYKTIKTSLISRLKTLVTEITDFSESNIYIIIVSAFAGLVEQLNYYIDSVARESFITTARRYSSMVKLTRLIDYRIKAKVSATVDLLVTAVDSSGDPVDLTTDDFTFDADIIVADEAGVEFITTQKRTMFLGTSSVVIPARQGEKITNENIGTTTSAANQTFQLDANYRHDSLQITINSQTWTLVDTFAFSGPTDRHFIVQVNEDKEAWVVFGDDTNGDIPTSGQVVYATYYKSEGLNGNLEAGTITEFDVSTEPDPSSWPEVDHFEVTNPLAAAGGRNEEGIEDIRAKAPLSLRTLDRAVTVQDHNDLALLVPGVGKAAVDYDSNLKSVVIYIAPAEGGTASSQLQTDVEDYFADKRILTTAIAAASTGETSLVIEMTVTVKFRRSTSEAETDIKSALQEAFGFNNSDINRKIRRSDLIALIDNLDKVDYLSLDILTTKPYPRVVSGSNSLEDKWTAVVQSTSDEIAFWRIVVTTAATVSSDGEAYVYRTGPSGGEEYDGVLTIHYDADPGSTDYTSKDGTLKLAAWDTSQVLSVGDQWNFKTYPYNENIEFEDFTVPIYDEDELTLNMNSQPIPE